MLDYKHQPKIATNSAATQRKHKQHGHTLVDNRTAPLQKKNNTGLPDTLKTGIENLSGHAMDDVKVHYNSNKPSQLNAHAYAQGTNIHLASGQEKHLPHEAWHVVQQKQGRVKPTTSFNGTAINDNVGLEKEADVMGIKALQMKLKENKSSVVANSVNQKKSNVTQGFGFVNNRPVAVAQRKLQMMTDSTKPTFNLSDHFVSENTNTETKKRNHSKEFFMQSTEHSSPRIEAVMQLTRYKKTRAGWKIIDTPSGASDSFGPPNLMNKKKGTIYDAETGKYYRPRKTMKKISRSKRKLRHGRHQTAFGAHDKTSTSSKQGPHNIAHITTAFALEVGEENGRCITEVLGSSLVPRPGQARHLRNRRLRMAGGRGLTSKGSKKRKRFDNRYKKKYEKAINPNECLKKRKKLTHELIEASPGATYRIAEGEASKADMVGKGERRTKSKKDLLKVRRLGKGRPLPQGLYTVDDNGQSTIEVAEDTRKRLRALKKFSFSEQLSEESCDSSDEE